MKKKAKKTARTAAKKAPAKAKKTATSAKVKTAAKRTAKAPAKKSKAPISRKAGVTNKKNSVPVTPKSKAVARQKAKALSVQKPKTAVAQKKKPSPSSVEQAVKEFPGYPLYPSSEDIYSQGKKEDDIDPENTSKKKTAAILDSDGDRNEKDFNDDVSGDDLDVPGSELDDEQEKVGSEDEENNYYSLGGDNHNDLEEDKGD